MEYGSSFSATLVEGSHAAINDSILNLNHLHLSQNVRTVFELVEDDGLRRGGDQLLRLPRPCPASAQAPAVAALARKIGVFDAAYGPSRFFFGELFASDRTGASPNLGVHAANDTQAAEIGRWLVARDGFDFLLYYLPDVDMAQHKHGPHGALDAVAVADRSIASLVDAGGGLDRFLENHGVVLLADHGQTAAREACDVRPALEGLRLFVSSLRSAPGDSAGRGGRVEPRLHALPAGRRAERRATSPAGLARSPASTWPRSARTAIWCSSAMALSCASGAAGRSATGRGNPWTVTGDFAALGLEQDGDVVAAPGYPNALERVACLLECVNAGEVVCSAAAGYEFVDGGGSHHVGGGSHGSLSADDSVVPLITVGVDASQLPGEPSITDAYGLVQRHFGL